MGGSTPVVEKPNQSLQYLEQKKHDKSNPAMQQLVSSYGSGKVSLQDALAQSDKLVQSQGLIQGNPFIEMVTTDPLAGSRMASEQALSDPTLAGLFGDGGLQSTFHGVAGNLGKDMEALSGKGDSYGLTPQDLMAYGQASDSLALQFGETGNSLAQSLANRGLASAPSGAAGAAFSGLLGNQNEQLAAAQQTIAKNRVDTAQSLANQRVQADLQAGGLSGSLAQIGQGALQNQWNRQTGSTETNFNMDTALAGLNMGNQSLQQNIKASQAQIDAANDPFQKYVMPLVSAGSSAIASIAGAPPAPKSKPQVGGGSLSSLDDALNNTPKLTMPTKRFGS